MSRTDLVQRSDVADAINREHEAACQEARSALEHARRAGELLLEAKGRVEHGAWLPWLAEHCPSIPERTAQAYMRIARRWSELEAKAQRVADLPMREALVLLADRTDADREGHNDAPVDLLALQGELTDDKEAADQVQRECAILARALTAPGLTVEDAGAIVRRADAIVGIGHRMKIENLAKMGALLIRARRDFGDTIADLLTTDPAALETACRTRITKLSAQEGC